MLGDNNNSKKKKNVWMLILGLAICVAYMIVDSIGLSLHPVVTGALLVITIFLLIAYIVSNYTKRGK